MSHFTSLYFYVFIPFVLLKILPINYHKYIINVITVLTCIALVIWVGVVISPSFYEFIHRAAIIFNQNNPAAIPPEQLIIFTYESETALGIVRNAGFCHEPGAFAVVLIYGLVFNSILTKSYFNLKNLLFTVAIITTFSSAGYIALFLFSLNIIWQLRNIFTKWLLVIGVVVLSFYSYYSLEFLSEKISEQYVNQFGKSLTATTGGRFLGMRKSLYVLSKYPLTGRGFNAVSQPKSQEDPEAARYGFMFYASRVGVIIFFFSILFFCRTIKFWNNLYMDNNSKTILKVLPFAPVLFAQLFIPSLLFNMLILEAYFRRYSIKVPVKNRLEMNNENDDD